MLSEGGVVVELENLVKEDNIWIKRYILDEPRATTALNTSWATRGARNRPLLEGGRCPVTPTYAEMALGAEGQLPQR